jgi:hypothetical protein
MQVQADLEVAAVLSGPAQGATVLTGGQLLGLDQQPGATAEEASAAVTSGHAVAQAELAAATAGSLAATAAAEAPGADEGIAWAWVGRAQSSIQRVLLGRSLKAAAQAGSSTSSSSSSNEHHMHGAAGSMATSSGTASAAVAGTSYRGSSSVGPSGSLVPGSTVGQQLSAVKKVSAVMDVDAQEFHKHLLHSFRQ